VALGRRRRPTSRIASGISSAMMARQASMPRVEERIDTRLARVYQAADAELSRGAEPLEAARRFVAMLQREREAYLLPVDFWNQAVREPKAAARFAERHTRLRAIIGRIVEGIAHDTGAELTHPRDQVATALIALANGFTIERLADPAAAPDELFAHALAATLRGFSRPRA
jgi:hypothetical protein